MSETTPGSDPHAITTVADLRDVIGSPTPGVELKVYDTLPPEARDFIGRAPFLVLATTDAAGNVDASPKGDAPGFVRILDDRTLLIPDRPGNKLAFGLTNLLENPRAGVIFVIPGTTETLRVNGTVALTRDPDLCRELAARGRPATLVLRLEVEQCFFHCAKAFLRSGLWKPDTWSEPVRLSFGRMFAERLDGDDALANAIDDGIAADYVENL